jgi:hypothetical protein
LVLDFSASPDPELLAASLGQAAQKSANNDCWALLRANQLREKLGWDMSIPLGEVPFKKLDELLSILLTMVRNKKGDLYPSATINNLLNSFSRILRQASELRAVEGRWQALENFNILRHFEFRQN